MLKNNFKLRVLDLIKNDYSIKQICRKLGFVDKANLPQFARIRYYIKQLENEGLIKKIGYGVWKVIEKDVAQSPMDANTPLNTPKTFVGTATKEIINKFNQNDERTHALRHNLLIPKILNWNKREEYLIKKGYEVKHLNGGCSFLFKTHKIHLYDKIIIIYYHKDYSIISNSITNNLKRADFEALKIFKGLEALFKTSLKIQGYYKLKLSKKETAFLKNELAKEYNKEKRKLYIFGDKYTLRIDKSYSIDELEVIKDNLVVGKALVTQRHENMLKAISEGRVSEDRIEKAIKLGVTAIEMQEATRESNVWMVENMKSHKEVLSGIKDAIKELREEIKKK